MSFNSWVVFVMVNTSLWKVAMRMNNRGPALPWEIIPRGKKPSEKHPHLIVLLPWLNVLPLLNGLFHGEHNFLESCPLYKNFTVWLLYRRAIILKWLFLPDHQLWRIGCPSTPRWSFPGWTQFFGKVSIKQKLYSLIVMQERNNPWVNNLTWSSTLTDWMSFHSSMVWARSTMHSGIFTSPI